MFQKRNLTTKELEFVTQKISKTKQLLLWTYIAIVLIVVFLAVIVYSSFEGYNVTINIAFGMLIMTIYTLSRYFKGYKNHVVDSKIHKSSGFYKRVVIYHGRQTSRFETINGANVKIPWHWRKYLKSQNERVNYEYIERDGAVAANDKANRYVISINDTLSLDYELKHGLKKAKSHNFLNYLSFFLILPVVLVSTMDRNLNKGLDIFQLLQDESEIVTLLSAEDLSTISKPTYITINDAWVHRYKTMLDYQSKNSLISTAERNRIYNNPSSNFNYTFFLPARALTKPDKATLEKNIKNSPLYEAFENRTISDSLWHKTITTEYNKRLKDYNKKVKRAEQAEKLLEDLQPKSIILELTDQTFSGYNKNLNSIKESLETPITVNGFYIPSEQRLISIEAQKTNRAHIFNAFILLCFLILVSLFTLYGLAKIIYNSVLKIKLVKDQLSNIDGPKRITD